MAAAYLREVVDELVEAFTGVFRFEPDPSLDEEASVDKVVHETGVVAGLIACVQPIPAADVVVLTPLHVKLALQIGRIKGFELTRERAAEMVSEVTGTVWLALTSQALIGIVGKIVPLARLVLTYPLNYAATWAIGQVTAYYFDCLRAGATPRPEDLRRVFQEQLVVGRRQGESMDGDLLRAKAEALRQRVQARDPRLRTKTRMDPLQRPTLPPAPPGARPPTAPPGERPKIKIVLGKRPEEAEDAPAEELTLEEEAPAATKTLGPAGAAREIEIGFRPADKTLGEPPAPTPPSAVDPEAALVSVASARAGEEAPTGSEPPEPGADQEEATEAGEPAASSDTEEPSVSGERDASSAAAARLFAGAETELRSVAPLASSSRPPGAARPKAAGSIAEGPEDEPAPVTVARLLDVEELAPPARSPDESQAEEPEEEPGLVAQLERLAQLRAQGALDEDEFRRAKERLLAP
ncbi:MAG: SHOCT domain-containing protein [Planctomycetota bacterium]